MPYVYEVNTSEIIAKLPGITQFNIEKDISDKVNDDLFLCALGFEDRSVHIPRMLSENRNYKCDQTIYFEYSTNIEDNEVNRPELMEALQSFSKLTLSIQCDTLNFTTKFRETLQLLCQKRDSPKITFDISACSSKLMLQVMKVLLDNNVELRIVYSEADIYHPTIDEINDDETINDTKKLTIGASKVYHSSEYPGYNLDAMPNAVIAFATFNPDRTQIIISDLDETLLGNSGNRLIWIVGKPHLTKNYWRMDYLKRVNNISHKSKVYQISTFDYKDTITCLCKLYDQHSMQYHLNISPLGSKMQSIGITFFQHIKPEVSVFYAPPESYIANKYSEGCREIWKIDFGALNTIKNTLDKIGMYQMTE